MSAFYHLHLEQQFFYCYVGKSLYNCEETALTAMLTSQSQSHITTDSRPVRLGVRRPSGTRDQFFFLHEIFF
jgi:uncharacterized protein YfaS (alpha-2-macroglobulin family)